MYNNQPFKILVITPNQYMMQLGLEFRLRRSLAMVVCVRSPNASISIIQDLPHDLPGVGVVTTTHYMMKMGYGLGYGEV